MMPSLLALKLGLTYRYDNRRENIIGWNPARSRRLSGYLLRLRQSSSPLNAAPRTPSIALASQSDGTYSN